MKDKGNYKLYFYILFAVVFLASILLDSIISKSIESIRFEALNSILLVLTSTIFQVLLFGTASIIVYLDKKKTVLYLWLSTAMAIALSIVLKAFIARPRPFIDGVATLSSLIKESYTSWNFSFPSNHAVVAFVVIPFLPKKWQIPWIILAITIAFSRVYFGLHYLSDVMAGAALGLGVSYLVLKKLK